MGTWLAQNTTLQPADNQAPVITEIQCENPMGGNMDGKPETPT